LDCARGAGSKVSSQTFDALLENQLYIGIIDVPEYGDDRGAATSSR
jgi:hypothetical protein